MIEKEQLVEFLEGIAMKDELEGMVTIEQIEEINRKLMARIDVQQGQLDGLQSLIGTMQVKITQLQLQVVKMEGLLAEKEAEFAALAQSLRTASNVMPKAEGVRVEVNPMEEKPVEKNTDEAVNELAGEAMEDVVEPEVEEKPIVDVVEPIIEVVNPVVEEVSGKGGEEKAIKEDAEEKPVKDKSGTQTIADSIKGEESLAEKLSKRVDKGTVASNINSSKIERIQTAITIADRFRFQRELFAGDAVKMADTVDKLNNMKNLDEALTYIDKNFKWDVDLQVTRDFLRLVERRFM